MERGVRAMMKEAKDRNPEEQLRRTDITYRRMPEKNPPDIMRKVSERVGKRIAEIFSEKAPNVSK